MCTPVNEWGDKAGSSSSPLLSHSWGGHNRAVRGMRVGDNSQAAPIFGPIWRSWAKFGPNMALELKNELYTQSRRGNIAPILTYLCQQWFKTLRTCGQSCEAQFWFFSFVLWLETSYSQKLFILSQISEGWRYCWDCLNGVHASLHLGKRNLWWAWWAVGPLHSNDASVSRLLMCVFWQAVNWKWSSQLIQHDGPCSYNKLGITVTSFPGRRPESTVPSHELEDCS